MGNFILLTACFTLGIVLPRLGRMPVDASRSLNAFIINVSLPALALHYIHGIGFESGLLFPAAMPVLIFAGSLLFALAGAKLFRLDRATTGCLIVVGGVSNTTIVGLPMIESWYGAERFGAAIVADQASFVVLCTVGIVIACIYSDSAASPRAIARKIALFPPVLAAFVALLLRPVPFPAELTAVLLKVGGTLTPLAMVSAGTLFSLGSLRSLLRDFAWGMAYKLLLAPALVYGLFVLALGARGEAVQIAIFEAAMPSMITAGIIAIEHKLNPPLATLLVGAAIPVSFVTLAGWWWLLRDVGGTTAMQ